jgi:hypothetical protein
MTKLQWLPENNISGCKQLIQEYWIRENAVNKVDTNVGTSQDEYQSSTNLNDSKYDKSRPSNNPRTQSSTSYHAESHDRSSSFFHNESFSQSSSQSRSESYANTCSQFYYESDVGSRTSKIQKSQQKVNNVHLLTFITVFKILCAIQSSDKKNILNTERI